VTEKALEAFQRKLTQYRLMRARCRVLDKPPPEVSPGGAQALLVGDVAPAGADKALHERAKQLQEPVVRRDKVLGTLTLNRV
jgi:hypothetical protein